ncbi:MAG: hypothetical protein PF961_24035 [Planctomycetota bacterium]|nr:hypothetical protein [Planctomycetota bacterium]
MPLLWLVDDTPLWHHVTAATLELTPGWRFAGLHTVNAAWLAFRDSVESQPSGLPRVILMDFYLGTARGDHLTEQLRDLEPEGVHTTIVGHSSMSHGSELIIQSGGDCAVTKAYNDAGINPHLLKWLKDFPEVSAD